MNSNVRQGKGRPADSDLRAKKRRDKSLHKFKEVLQDLQQMLRLASGMETVYLYWINRARQQFVMETKSTSADNIVFEDRLPFEDHFLNDHRDIREPVSLEVGKDIDPEKLHHYYGDASTQYITLLPFVNNDETVAITVLESGGDTLSPELDEVIFSYMNAMGNVLSTYLEISNLYDNENEWSDYEASLQFLDTNGHFADLLKEMLNTMQGFVQQGGVSLIAQGMGVWCNVMNAAEARRPVPVGMQVEEQSVAKNALESGEPELAIHFNRNPRRISAREHFTDGATLAIPMKFNDFRKAVILVYEKNPLTFKESTQHKLTNIVRLAALKIQAKLRSRDKQKDFLCNDYGAFIPDLWERSVDMQIKRLKNDQAIYHSWVGMVSLAGLSEIRTQLRLDELDMMQRDLMGIFNPGKYGIPGFVGFHSDYTYTVFIQSKDPEAVSQWVDEVRNVFRTPVELTSGKLIRTDLNISFEELRAESGESYRVISHLKSALSRRVNAN
jgi:hypothetical protein